jgi:hypothetical protein
MHLSPLDPSKFREQGAGSHSPMSSPVATKRTAELSSRDAGVGAANALAGRLAEAQKAMVHLRNIDSVLRVSTIKEWVPLRRPDDLARTRGRTCERRDWARVTRHLLPRTTQIITPFDPISSTRKGRLHAVSQQRTFSAPSTNSASFFRA